MSIDKTVKRVKKLAEHKRYEKYPEIVQAQVKKDDGAEEIYSPDTDFLVLAANSIMSIIAELETANKRIAELEIKFDKQKMYIDLLEQSFSEKVDNETFVSEKEYCVGTVQARFCKGAGR